MSKQSKPQHRAHKGTADRAGDCTDMTRGSERSDVPSPPPNKYPTYFDLLLGRFEDRALWFWVSISLIGVATSYIFYLKTGLNRFLGTFMFLALGIGAVPIAMRAAYSITLNWTAIIPDFIKDGSDHMSDICKWIDRQFNELKQSRTPVIFAIAYSVFALVVFALGGAFESLTLRLELICILIVLISGFTCGIGLCVMGYLGRLIWRLGHYLGQFDVRISDHSFGILSTGRTLLKCYIIIAIVWCIYTGSATAGLKQGWVPIGLLSLPAICFFIGSFIICQIPLHAQMVNVKRTELRHLEGILTKLSPSSDDDLDAGLTKKIEFLNSELQRVKNLPEWPFSAGSISGILMSALLTVAPQVVKLALSQIQFSAK